MAKVTAKALQSLSGSYGQVNEGDSFSLDENAAKELEEKGALKITGAAKEDETSSTKTSNVTVNTTPPKTGAKKTGKK